MHRYSLVPLHPSSILLDLGDVIRLERLVDNSNIVRHGSLVTNTGDAESKKVVLTSRGRIRCRNDLEM